MRPVVLVKFLVDHTYPTVSNRSSMNVFGSIKRSHRALEFQVWMSHLFLTHATFQLALLNTVN